MWVCRLRSGGIECTAGPRAHDCDGAAEGSDLRLDGESERAIIDQDIQAVQASEGKALLGQSFLVERILRRHDWSGCGDDPEVCEIPGKEGTVRGTAKPGDLGKPMMAQLQADPLGAGTLPPVGADLKATSFGRGFFTMRSPSGSSALRMATSWTPTI